jgi:CBS domain-containing protein
MVNYTPAVVGHLKDVEINTESLIRDHMSNAYISLDEDTLINEASSSLLKMNLTGAPVVSKTGALVGFLSEKDCLKFVLDSKYYNHTPSTVGHFMSTKVMTLAPDDTLLHAVELFMKYNFQMYPVVDDHRVIGIVSRKMVLEAVTGLSQTKW